MRIASQDLGGNTSSELWPGGKRGNVAKRRMVGVVPIRSCSCAAALPIISKTSEMNYLHQSLVLWFLHVLILNMNKHGKINANVLSIAQVDLRMLIGFH